jgi:hypothetical protein
VDDDSVPLPVCKPRDGDVEGGVTAVVDVPADDAEPDR